MSNDLKTVSAGFALLVFWGVLGVYTSQMSLPAFGGGIAYDPLFFPQILIGAGVILAIVLIVQGGRPLLAGLAGSADDDAPQNVGRIVVVMAMVGCYFAVMPIVGFPISTVVFLMVFALVLGYRNPVGILATALLGPLVIWYVFTAGLEAPLPAWPSF